jgi:hypothetical protein
MEIDMIGELTGFTSAEWVGEDTQPKSDRSLWKSFGEEKPEDVTYVLVYDPKTAATGLYLYCEDATGAERLDLQNVLNHSTPTTWDINDRWLWMIFLPPAEE